jgi:hypothetical protein
LDQNQLRLRSRRRSGQQYRVYDLATVSDRTNTAAETG